MPPSLMTRAPQVTAYADMVLNQVKLMENPYFQALRSGQMTLERFQRTQEQFYFAVTFFPRPMAALLSKIPNPYVRKDVLHNLVEEHGDFQAEAYHEATIRRFVENIGGNTDFSNLRVWPEVHAFNNLLLGTCSLDELEVGASCLGMIEYAFIDISATIARITIQHGWVTPQKLTHYALHTEIDPRHAEDFFALVEPHWESPSCRRRIEKGLELGAYIWDRFYRDLYLKAVDFYTVSSRDQNERMSTVM